MDKDRKRTIKIIERVGAVIGTLILLIFLFKSAIYFMPFLIAGVIAILIEPVIKFFMNKLKFSRRMSSVIVVVLTVIILGVAVAYGSISLIKEIISLSSNLGPAISEITQNVTTIIDDFTTQYAEQITPEIIQGMETSILSFVGKLGEIVSDGLTKVLQMLFSIPTTLINITITILALIFFTKDRIYVIDLMEHHLPKSWIKKIKEVVGETFSTIGSYIRVYAKIIVITFAELFLAFNIYRLIGFNIAYPFSLALIIAIIDILPILGVGTVLVPWALWLFVTGQYGFGTAVIVTYFIIYIIRQFIEPKLVSKQLGIHPLITLFAMYAGFRAAGVFGLILGPITLMALKCIFAKQLEKGFFKDLFDEK